VLLLAAILPPPSVLEEVRRVAASVQAPERVEEPRSRFGRRRTPPAWPEGPPLDLVPTLAMHLPVARFGNLPLPEAERLADAMDEQAPSWETPRLRLSGGVALEPEGDRSAWVKVSGDTDALGSVVRGVPQVAQGLQLFVDRRGFRPLVRVGTITHQTTVGYLEALLAALDAFESNAWWQTTVTLLTPAADRGPDALPFRVIRDFPLGPAVPH
jgi:2'-5' RNA ligase